MKKSLALLILAATSLVGCTTVGPNAGEEAVLVYKPMFLGSGGIDPTPVKTGLTYVAFTTSSIKVNMQPQRVDMVFDDMMTKSGVPVDFHVVLTFRVTDSVKLAKDFGADRTDQGVWNFFLRNLDQPIRTAVRDEVKKYEMQEMAISTTAVDKVQTAVEAATKIIIKSSGVPIDVTTLNVGKVNPPDSVKHQRIETATQEQRIITEQQRKLAEDQRKSAEESRAAADNAYNQQMHLDPTQYVKLEQIKALRDICMGGKCQFVSGVQPLLDIK